MINSSERNSQGIIYGLLATLLWGAYPIWYKQLSGLNAWEVLSWRIVWSEVFLVLFTLFSNRSRSFVRFIGNPPWKNILVMSFTLGFWWFFYIYGVLSDQVLEVALGYFLSPLMSILASRLIFKENINSYQITSVVLASIGVCLMVWRVGHLPWIALCIGFCFSFYGIFKKNVTNDPVVTQAFEMLILLPFALAFLLWWQRQGQSYPMFSSWNTDMLLISTGLISVLPLWWYSLAAGRLPLIVLSFLQFIPPSCNFLLGVFVYDEAFDRNKLFVFLFIWIGLFLFVIDMLRKYKLNRNRSVTE